MYSTLHVIFRYLFECVYKQYHCSRLSYVSESRWWQMYVRVVFEFSICTPVILRVCLWPSSCYQPCLWSVMVCSCFNKPAYQRGLVFLWCSPSGSYQKSRCPPPHTCAHTHTPPKPPAKMSSRWAALSSSIEVWMEGSHCGAKICSLK